MIRVTNGAVSNEVHPLVASAIANLKLGYPACNENAPMSLKLQVYHELAGEAQDCYRKRAVRECGEDFGAAIAQYRRAVESQTAPSTIAMFEKSLAEMADLVADMLIPTEGCR